MKKFFIGFLLFALSGPTVANSISMNFGEKIEKNNVANAQSGIGFDDYKIETYSVLGHGVNLPQTSLTVYDSVSLNQQKSGEIFDSQWLRESYKNGYFKPHVTSETQLSYANTITDLVEKMKTKTTTSVSGQASYGPYAASVAASLSTSTDSSLRKQSDYLFVVVSYLRTLFRYTLPTITQNDLDEKLSKTFVSAIENVLTQNTESCFKEFADIYGTHVLNEAIYGGAYNITLNANSDKYDLSSKTACEVATKIGGKGQYEGVDFSASAENDFSLENELGLSKNSINQKINAAFYGGRSSGTSFVDTKLSVILSEAAKWVDGLDSLVVPVQYTNLIPIWDFLPSYLKTTSNTNKLKILYQKYVDFCDENPVTFCQSYESVLTEHKQIVSSEKSVYFGSCVGKDHYGRSQTLNLANHRENKMYNLQELIKANYRKMKLNVSFKMTEYFQNSPKCYVNLTFAGKTINLINGPTPGRSWVAYSFDRGYRKEGNVVTKTEEYLEYELKDVTSDNMVIELDFTTNGWAFLTERKIALRELIIDIVYTK